MSHRFVGRIEIERKVEAGRRLSASDALYLASPRADLHWLGQLAHAVRRRMHGTSTFYNINTHLNPTNICTMRCPLCAFSCDAEDAAAYCLSPRQMLEQAGDAYRAGATEIHIVSGIHPDKPYAWYREIISTLKSAYPDLHIKAWTAAEIAHFAHLEGTSTRAILEDMINAGLGSLPGGGAEIFADRPRRRIAPRKITAGEWLDVHRTAHQLGLRSTATMLFGHVETAEDRVDHLLRLRSLQDETGGFQAFVPLAFHPDGTPLHANWPMKKTSSIEQLRVIALSRLVLDNVPHIKAYWISLGIGTAQAALSYGADDLDGTVRHERIHHDAGSRAPHILTVETLQRLIRETGNEPVERDTLYQRVQRDG